MSGETVRGSNYSNTNGRNSPFLVKGMPVVPGRVQGKFTSVLLDNGSDTAIVRRDMVDDDCLTGMTSRLVLLDGSDLVGEIIAACMGRPI